MPIVHNALTTTITSIGGTANLLVSAPYNMYIFEPSTTTVLTSNYSIGTTTTVSSASRVTFNIVWNANIILNGNSITVFGQTMPKELANKEHKITAFWDGIEWDVTFTADIGDTGVIPYNSLTGTFNQTIVTVPISFETGEQGRTVVHFPLDGDFKLVRYAWAVTDTIEATDDAIIEFKVSNTNTNIPINQSPFTNWFIPAGTVRGTDNNLIDIVDFGDYTMLNSSTVTVKTRKTTPGGKAILYITIEKI